MDYIPSINTFMNIPVRTHNDTKIKSEIKFDDHGNLYFELGSNDIFKDKELTTYQVDIDGKGDLVIDLSDYKILDVDSSSSNLGRIHVDKTKKTDAHEFMDKEDSDAEDEGAEDVDPYGSVDEKYYPEEKGYFYSIPTDDYIQSRFFFCQSHNNIIPINKRNNGDVLALYDTHLYDDSNNLSFRSKLLGEPPLYIVKIYKNGIITYRETCNVEGNKHYYLFLNPENNIELKLVGNEV